MHVGGDRSEKGPQLQLKVPQSTLRTLLVP